MGQRRQERQDGFGQDTRGWAWPILAVHIEVAHASGTVVLGWFAYVDQVRVISHGGLNLQAYRAVPYVRPPL